ncbi:MAG: hypothetical protein Fur0037_22430 [Planctomycetota bacterium]
MVNDLIDSSPPFIPGTPPSLELPLGAAPLPDSWHRWQRAPGTAIGSNVLMQDNRMTDFEGVDRDDLEAGGFDYNGFEGAKWNISNQGGGGQVPQSAQEQMHYLGLHMTSERNGRPAGPTRDISHYTNDNGSGSIPPGGTRLPRGILFVRDLIHEGARPGGPFDLVAPLPNPQFGLCLGDFRLSPGTRGHAAALQPPTEGNLCVDAGYTWTMAANGSLVPLVMDNGLPCSPDAIALGSEDGTFPYHANEWDGEGYGNPRVYDHPVYSSLGSRAPAGVSQAADLGMDELDDLLIAGYREKTTTFLAAPQGLPTADNDYLLFLCASEGLQDANQPTNPAINLPPDFVTNLPIHSPYPADALWSPVPSAPYYHPRLDDVMPHLMPDIHPYWMPSGVNTNILWHPCQSANPPYNPTLYLDPSAGIINPPGSYTVAAPVLWNWLEGDIYSLFN